MSAFRIFSAVSLLFLTVAALFGLYVGRCPKVIDRYENVRPVWNLVLQHDSCKGDDDCVAYDIVRNRTFSLATLSLPPGKAYLLLNRSFAPQFEKLIAAASDKDPRSSYSAECKAPLSNAVVKTTSGPVGTYRALCLENRCSWNIHKWSITNSEVLSGKVK